MSDTSPDIIYDCRLVVAVPAPFKAALARAARTHNAPVADFIREALNVALRDEPTTGQDRNFSLLPTATSQSLAHRGRAS